MTVLSLLAGAFGWLVSETQILSHVARTLVERSLKKADSRIASPPIVVNLKYRPELEYNPILEYFVSPMPSKFLLLSPPNGESETPVVGVMLEGDDPQASPGQIVWFPLTWNSPTDLNLPSNTLGALFATIPSANSSALDLRHLETFGSIDGKIIATLVSDKA